MNSIYDELLAAIHSVWNRRWMALAVAWGVCLLGWLVVAMVPNGYESRARIFVQLDDALAEQIGIGLNDRKRDIDRVQQTLTSAVNLEKVVRTTQLGKDITTPKQMEATVLGLAKAIKVTSQQDNLFEITAVSRRGSLSDAQNAKLAQDIVQKMIDIFREENMAGGRGEMGETLEFMNTQLADRQKELEAAEARRTAFETQHPEMVQGGVGAFQRLETARAELRGIDGDLAAAQSALAAINGQLAGTPQTIAGVGPSGGARGALAQASAELAGMRARGMTDNHPDVIAIKNQLAALRAAVAAEGNTGPGGVPNPAYSSLVSIKAERQANVQSLQTRRSMLQTEVAGMTSNQLSNPQLTAEAQRISRDYDVLKQQYDKLLQDREQLRLRGQVQTERNSVKFQVVDPPTTPRAPAAPNRPLLLLGVLILGLGAGLGAAFAVGQLRATFSTTSKLEQAIGLPVLGSITETLNEAGREMRRRRRRQFVAGTGALGIVFIVLMIVEFIQVQMVA
jgi:polysaccharide chain length determinant protein (PEP-CTERM system associated)